jgi:hypothetical protein
VIARKTRLETARVGVLLVAVAAMSASCRREIDHGVALPPELIVVEGAKRYAQIDGAMQVLKSYMLWTIRSRRQN